MTKMTKMTKKKIFSKKKVDQKEFHKKNQQKLSKNQ